MRDSRASFPQPFELKTGSRAGAWRQSGRQVPAIQKLGKKRPRKNGAPVFLLFSPTQPKVGGSTGVLNKNTTASHPTFSRKLSNSLGQESAFVSRSEEGGVAISRQSLAFPRKFIKNTSPGKSPSGADGCVKLDQTEHQDKTTFFLLLFFFWGGGVKFLFGHISHTQMSSLHQVTALASSRFQHRLLQRHYSQHYL